MCLAIPMVVQELYPDNTGVAGDVGSSIKIDLSLVPEARQGDYVIVHAGYAIELLNRDEAEQRIQLFDALAASQREGPCDT